MLEHQKNEINEDQVLNLTLSSLQPQQSESPAVNRKSPENGLMVVEIEIPSNRLIIFGIIITVCSIILCFYHLLADILLLTQYHGHGSTSYFALTLFFIVFPTIAVGINNILLYLPPHNSNKFNKGIKIILVLFSCLHLSLVLRYISSIYYSLQTVKSRKNPEKHKEYYKQVLQEDSDAAFLFLYEAFCESACQLTIQLYIIFVEVPNFGLVFYSSFQGMAIFVSFSSLAFCLLTFNRSMRLAQENKLKLDLLSWGSLLMFVWQLGIVVSRVTILALFASAYPKLKIILPLYALHWLGMFVWINWQHHRNSKCEPQPQNDRETEQLSQKNLPYVLISQFLYAVTAHIYIFVYFNTLDKPSRWKYAFYYGICVVENALLLFFTLRIHNSAEIVYISSISFSLFFLGVFFMLIYFKWFHPSKGAKFRDERRDKYRDIGIAISNNVANGQDLTQTSCSGSYNGNDLGT